VGEERGAVGHGHAPDHDVADRGAAGAARAVGFAELQPVWRRGVAERALARRNPPAQAERVEVLRRGAVRITFFHTSHLVPKDGGM
jgi:hypothetical protein